MDVDCQDEIFDRLVRESLDELPRQYIENLNNVAILAEDEPSEYQKQQAKVGPNSLLFGLYEGIPLSKRGTGTTMALPDKITLFKKAIRSVSRNDADLKERIKRTLWHEIAHHYGLDHDQIHKLEDK